MRRNHAINPNADVYFVQKLKDGQHQLLKSENLESTNGNIRIGNNNYDLQPAVADAGTRHLFEDVGVPGKRYVLQDQTYFGKTNSVENKDVANIQEINGKQKLQAFLRESNGKNKQNPFIRADDSLSSQNFSDLHNSWKAEKSYRSKDEYYVDVMVLIDFGVWEL
ncbi:hypothetical protein CHS0354_025304 [Potamilus streckersoni]|uniref:Uncharacterized protein n=1 Tax=Potamilus streckersoni TaxID=2493646 RepID=A0AAE0RUN5_9BIVA|nr:hypothetical protein CHS0354_025304 [Potamilus streckersoni]